MRRRTMWLGWGWALFLGGCLAGNLRPPAPPAARFPPKKPDSPPPLLPDSSWVVRKPPDDSGRRFIFPPPAAAPPPRSPAPGLILSQLVFKGAALGDLTFHLDSAALPLSLTGESSLPFAQVSLTGSLDRVPGFQVAEPRGEVPASTPLVPVLVTVPDPSSHALGLAAVLALAFRRQRS